MNARSESPASILFDMSGTPVDLLRSSRVASLLKAEAGGGEELRFDDVSGGDLYIGRAADGTLTAAASWEVVRYYRTSTGVITRARYRTGVAWDLRDQGW